MIPESKMENRKLKIRAHTNLARGMDDLVIRSVTGQIPEATVRFREVGQTESAQKDRNFRGGVTLQTQLQSDEQT